MSAGDFQFHLVARPLGEGELVSYREGEATYDLKLKGVPVKVVVDPAAIGVVMGLVATAMDGDGILLRIEVD